MTPAPLQLGQAPSELELNSAGFTPLAFANALRIGSSSPVYVAGLLRREPRIAVWSTATTPSRPDTEPWISELFPEPGHAGHHHQHAERDVDIDVLQIVGVGAAHLERADRRPHRRLQGGPVVEVAAGDGVAGAQPLDGALEHHLAAGSAGAGAEIDDVVGDRDRLRLVLHDQHGVALVPQLQQQVVHPLNVVRVQARGGLVEHVGDVGERGARCALLFDRAEVEAGRYRAIPERRLRLTDLELDDLLWEELRLPVDIAFLLRTSGEARAQAFYPSPMGATESQLRLDAWDALEAANPVLGTLVPDVEALLVDRARGARRHWLVPIDECFALVGLIRTRWRGLTGGKEVWQELDRFFDGLDERSRPASRNDGKGT